MIQKQQAAVCINTSTQLYITTQIIAVYKYIDSDTDIDADSKYDVLNKEIDDLKKLLTVETMRANRMQNIAEQRASQLTELQDEINELKNEMNAETEDEKQNEVNKSADNAAIKRTDDLNDSNTINDAVDSIKSWIEDQTMDNKQFKEKLAVLLCSHTSEQRNLIRSQYPTIMDDITKKLKKGQFLTLCHGFFAESIAAYSASIIDTAIKEGNFDKIGDILCTQSNEEIEEIIDAYAQMSDQKQDLVKDIKALCDKNSRGSIWTIFNALLLTGFRNEWDMEVERSSIECDVDFLINTKKFKGDKKKRCIKIFCQKHFTYIQELTRQFNMKSNGDTLEKMIEKKLGSDSGSGYLTMTLLKYSIDSNKYFCDILYDLGLKFDKNREEIGRIFLSRSELDLDKINKDFARTKYCFTLDKWVEDKAEGSKFGFLLLQMLREK